MYITYIFNVKQALIPDVVKRPFQKQIWYSRKPTTWNMYGKYGVLYGFHC